MYNVFSEKIIEFSEILNCAPEKEFAKLTTAFKNVKDKLLYISATVTTNSNFLEIDNEKMYEIILSNKDLQNVIYWINKKILIQIDTLESKTLEVRIRIATSMLNKVIQDYKIDPIVGIIIHDNFVKNVKDLFVDLNTDELPF